MQSTHDVRTFSPAPASEVRARPRPTPRPRPASSVRPCVGREPAAADLPLRPGVVSLDRWLDLSA